MTPESVYESFMEKDHQKQSLLCSVQEVVMSDQIINLNSDIYNFLARLSQLLEQGNIMMEDEAGEGTINVQQNQQPQYLGYEMFDQQTFQH